MLIPYCFRNGNLFVFLQRRSDDAPRNPSKLGGFGGGLEGSESNDEALIREMNEELEYKPEKYSLLGTFETDYSVSNYYIEEVPSDFEKSITVHEGKGGEWHSALMVIERIDISQNTKRAIIVMSEKLSQKN